MNAGAERRLQPKVLASIGDSAFQSQNAFVDNGSALEAIQQSVELRQRIVLQLEIADRCWLLFQARYLTARVRPPQPSFMLPNENWLPARNPRINTSDARATERVVHADKTHVDILADAIALEADAPTPARCGG